MIINTFRNNTSYADKEIAEEKKSIYVGNVSLADLRPYNELTKAWLKGNKKDEEADREIMKYQRMLNVKSVAGIANVVAGGNPCINSIHILIAKKDGSPVPVTDVVFKDKTGDSITVSRIDLPPINDPAVNDYIVFIFDGQNRVEGTYEACKKNKFRDYIEGTGVFYIDMKTMLINKEFILLNSQVSVKTVTKVFMEHCSLDPERLHGSERDAWDIYEALLGMNEDPNSTLFQRLNYGQDKQYLKQKTFSMKYFSDYLVNPKAKPGEGFPKYVVRNFAKVFDDFLWAVQNVSGNQMGDVGVLSERYKASYLASLFARIIKTVYEQIGNKGDYRMAFKTILTQLNDVVEQGLVSCTSVTERKNFVVFSSTGVTNGDALANADVKYMTEHNLLSL